MNELHKGFLEVSKEYVPYFRRWTYDEPMVVRRQTNTTLLFFENQFFSPGVFRASSHPITNQGDTRRLTHIVTDDIQFFELEKIV